MVNPELGISQMNRGSIIKSLAALSVVMLALSSVGTPGVYLANEYFGDGGDKQVRNDGQAAAVTGGAAVTAGGFAGAAGTSSVVSGTAATALTAAGVGLSLTGVGLAAVGVGMVG
jgi:hypothetical protein